MHGGTRTTIAAAMTVATLVATTACGLGDKSAQANLIAATPKRAIEARSGAGTLTIESTPRKETTAVQTSVPEGAQAAMALAFAPSTVTVPVVFDFAHARSAIELTPAAPAPAPAPAPDPATTTTTVAPTVAAPTPGPTALFLRDTAFVKRINRRPSERRVWARLDYAHLPKDDRAPDQSQLTNTDRLHAIANGLNPQYVLQLSTGTLAGSVTRVGKEDLAGVPVTHYRANISLDKAHTDLDLTDDEVATRVRMFELAGLRRDVNAAEYWLDADGLLRKATFHFEQRLLPRIHNDVVVTVDVPQYGIPVDVAPPTNDETVRVDRYGRFIRASLARKG
jgi:hypothetical protein